MLHREQHRNMQHNTPKVVATCTEIRMCAPKKVTTDAAEHNRWDENTNTQTFKCNARLLPLPLHREGRERDRRRRNKRHPAVPDLRDTYKLDLTRVPRMYNRGGGDTNMFPNECRGTAQE